MRYYGRPSYYVVDESGRQLYVDSTETIDKDEFSLYRRVYPKYLLGDTILLKDGRVSNVIGVYYTCGERFHYTIEGSSFVKEDYVLCRLCGYS